MPEESTELTTYAVRLLFKVPARSPREAVRAMVTQLAEHGVVNWAFRVLDMDTQEDAMLNGRGETIDTEAFRAEGKGEILYMDEP